MGREIGLFVYDREMLGFPFFETTLKDHVRSTRYGHVDDHSVRFLNNPRDLPMAAMAPAARKRVYGQVHFLEEEAAQKYVFPRLDSLHNRSASRLVGSDFERVPIEVTLEGSSTVIPAQAYVIVDSQGRALEEHYNGYQIQRPRTGSATLPILVSIPHCGRQAPKGFLQKHIKRENLASRLIQLFQVSDQFTDVAFENATDVGALAIKAKVLRVICNYNRDWTMIREYDGKILTDDKPGAMTTIREKNLEERADPDSYDVHFEYYDKKPVTKREKNEIFLRHWDPYHQQAETAVSELIDRFGGALFFEQHTSNAESFKGPTGYWDVSVGSLGFQAAHIDLVHTCIDILKDLGYRAGVALEVEGDIEGMRNQEHYFDPRRNLQNMILEWRSSLIRYDLKREEDYWRLLGTYRAEDITEELILERLVRKESIKQLKADFNVLLQKVGEAMKPYLEKRAWDLAASVVSGRRPLMQVVSPRKGLS